MLSFKAAMKKDSRASLTVLEEMVVANLLIFSVSGKSEDRIEAISMSIFISAASLDPSAGYFVVTVSFVSSWHIALIC